MDEESPADDGSGDVETLGRLAPETTEAVEARVDLLGPAAQTVTRELARAMAFDREEYETRVTGDVVTTARDALFASLLEVHVGDREAFDAFRERHPDASVVEAGHPDAGRVVWHHAPLEDTVVAATFADEQDAAVAALRRQAFGRVYRPRLYDDAEPPADGSAGARDQSGLGPTGGGDANRPDG